jgi:hypothetical protein
LPTVPSVIGQTQTDATDQLKKDGFSAEVQPQQVADASQQGIVLAQEPAGDSSAEADTTVKLTVGEYVTPQSARLEAACKSGFFGGWGQHGDSTASHVLHAIPDRMPEPLESGLYPAPPPRASLSSEPHQRARLSEAPLPSTD